MDWRNRVLTGDVRDRLDDLPADSVHMCMTSPPYFGLRDYGHDDQIGLEDELDEYIAELVDVFREIRRVLRPDGSAWLNLGDSYAGSWGGQSHDTEKNREAEPTPSRNPARNAVLGRKNKMLVPHRVAIALQDDGWVVRNDVTWVKPNPMPSSVKDRLNTTTEQIFHLTPEPDYWYDLDAIRGPYSESMERRKEYQSKHGGHESDGWGGGSHHQGGGLLDDSQTHGDTMHPAGKNPGDVFEVTTKPFPDAHFAVYPPELCEKPIKATCPPKVCIECGSPYERETVESVSFHSGSGRAGNEPEGKHAERAEANSGEYDIRMGPRKEIEHKGWSQSCDCETDETQAGIALDPFAGAGTTLLKAKELGRRFAGVELNAEYADMARARIGLSPNDPAHVRETASQRGFEAFTDGGHD
jgi:DNA modification methylase